MSDTLPLHRAGSVRAIERRAFAGGATPEGLMREAGMATARYAMQRWPQASRVGVLCGPGNNGGDGYVAALALANDGRQVVVLALAAPTTPAAAAAAEAWRASGGGMADVGDGLPSVDLWLDAVFGIGLSRPPAREVAAVFEAVARSGLPVLAIDVPSGIDADTGGAPGAFLPADATLAFIAAKPGLLTGRGREASGTLVVAGLGMVPGVAGEGAPEPCAFALRPSALVEALPRRRIDSHKGDHGRVVCIGGDMGMAGALVLCAEAAARSGAGIVEALGSVGAVSALHLRCPEVMARPLAASTGLEERLAMATVVAIGPGLGRDALARAAWEAAKASARPLVVDADALHLLAEAPTPLPGAILTPHPGEAARLLGGTNAEVQADRFAAAAALACRFGAVVVLKGAGTIVAAPGERPRVIDAGNPGMASAGMGDVLTGVIAALRAQGLPAFEAAWAGALAHAEAGDRAASRGARGLLAHDLIAALRGVLNPTAGAAS